MRVGFLKLGNIGLTQLIEAFLDERADRQDLEIRSVSTGTKLGESQAEFCQVLRSWDPELVIVISPNAALPGPTKARDYFRDRRTIVISDGASLRIKSELESAGFGYLILTGDPLIGARREFLDPVEMALFNADVMQILAISGAVRAVTSQLDKAIQQPDYLPRLVIDAQTALDHSGLKNPYAKAKAYAAYKLAELAAQLDFEACFKLKQPEQYILVAAAAHELVRLGAMLAAEARELEKSQDTVYRTPHAKDGSTLEKFGLMEPFKK